MDDSLDIGGELTDTGSLTDIFGGTGGTPASIAGTSGPSGWTGTPAVTPSLAGTVNTSSANTNNSLIAALGGDAAKIGTAFIAADAVKAGIKANPLSSTTLLLVGGGVVALILVVVLLKD